MENTGTNSNIINNFFSIQEEEFECDIPYIIYYASCHQRFFIVTMKKKPLKFVLKPILPRYNNCYYYRITVSNKNGSFA